MNNPMHLLIVDSIMKSLRYVRKRKINILDFGCGDGTILKTLPISLINCYVGYDINTNSIKEAIELYGSRKNVQFFSIKNRDKYSWRSKNKIDVFLLLGVIQYMDDQQIMGVLQACKRVLGKTGHIVIVTCADHWIYRFIDIYGYVRRHRFFSSKKIQDLLKNSGFRVTKQREFGLVFAPLFSSVISLGFDSLDVLLHTKKKGSLGILGQWARRVTAPLILKEYTIPINYGYTSLTIGH